MIDKHLTYFSTAIFTCRISDNYTHNFKIGDKYSGDIILSCIPKEFHHNFSINNPIVPFENEYFETENDEI